MPINIERYILPSELAERLADIALDIEQDLINSQPLLPSSAARQAVASIFNSFAYQIHMRKDLEPGEEDSKIIIN